MGEDEIAQAPAPAPNFPRADQSCVALDTRCVFSFVSLGLFTDRIVFIHPLVLFLSLAWLCLSSIFLFALSSFLYLHLFLPLILRSLFPPYFLLPSSLPSYLSSIFMFFCFPFCLRNLIPFNLSMFQKLE